MFIWGRLIGTLLGLKVFGLLGGIIGYFLGNWFDQGLKLHLYQIPRSRSASVQKAFFKATFSVMGHVAKADGRVSPDEIKAAERVMSRLELNENLRQEAIQYFAEGKASGFNLDKTLADLMQECGKYPDLLRFFVEVQCETALADGELSSNKKHILLRICEKLNFSPHEFEQFWARQWASQAFHRAFSGDFSDTFNAHARSSGQQYQYRSQGYAGQSQSRASYEHSKASQLQEAYGVLGVPASASPAEIKKAYRKLMNQHHPDKLAARGLPEGMAKMAKEKTQEIRAAYDLIREARGFK